MVLQNLPTSRLPRPLAGAIHHLLKVDELDRLYERTRGPEFARHLLHALQVGLHVTPADCARIPAIGPVIAISNHPFGILDGIVLVDLLTRTRPDVRVLTNRMLGDLPELAQLCFFVDPFDNRANRAANSRALRQAIGHVQSGGLLLVFPAGEVSHFDLRKCAICDPAWHPMVVRLIRRTKARTLPVLIAGANGLPFQVLGMIHPRLRTAALPAELLNKRGRIIEVRIGRVVDAFRLDATPDDGEALRYLRLRTELLARRDAARPRTSAPS